MTWSRKHILASSASHPTNRALLTNEILAFLESHPGTPAYWPSHTAEASPPPWHFAKQLLGWELSSPAPQSCQDVGAPSGFGWTGLGGSAWILQETKKLTCEEFQQEPRSPSLPPSPVPVHVSLLSAPRFRERHSLGCVKTTTPQQQGN